MLAVEIHQGFCKHLGKNYASIILQEDEMAISAMGKHIRCQSVGPPLEDTF